MFGLFLTSDRIFFGWVLSWYRFYYQLYYQPHMIKKLGINQYWLGIKLGINLPFSAFPLRNLFNITLRFKGAWTKSRTIKGRNATVQFLVRTSILYRV